MLNGSDGQRVNRVWGTRIADCQASHLPLRGEPELRWKSLLVTGVSEKSALGLPAANTRDAIEVRVKAQDLVYSQPLHDGDVVAVGEAEPS